MIEILGCKDYYVTNNGEIYRFYKTTGFKRIKSRILQGYEYVALNTDNGERKNFRVHRLVAKAFVNNPYNYPVVNHIDGNKLNNNYYNLEWCTVSMNTKHAFDTGLARNDIGIEDSQSIPVAIYRVGEYDILSVYGSISEAARVLGVGKNYIARNIKSSNAHINSRLGYYFRSIDIYEYINYAVKCKYINIPKYWNKK